MKKINFESALQRIQQINDKISSGEVSLDESLELFKEAAELIAFCNKRLSEAKLTVEEYKSSMEEQ